MDKFLGYLVTDFMHTHIKTEIIFVYVHMYDSEEIISPPYLKIYVCGSVY